MLDGVNVIFLRSHSQRLIVMSFRHPLHAPISLSIIYITAKSIFSFVPFTLRYVAYTNNGTERSLALISVETAHVCQGSTSMNSVSDKSCSCSRLCVIFRYHRRCSILQSLAHPLHCTLIRYGEAPRSRYPQRARASPEFAYHQLLVEQLGKGPRRIARR